jgi:hypothetical protein
MEEFDLEIPSKRPMFRFGFVPHDNLYLLTHLDSSCDHIAADVYNDASTDDILGIDTDKLLSSAISVECFQSGVINEAVLPAEADSDAVEAVIINPLMLQALDDRRP